MKPFETVFAAGLKQPGKIVADDPDIELLASILRERTGIGKVRDPERWHEARHMLKIVRAFLDRSGISDRLIEQAAAPDGLDVERLAEALVAEIPAVHRWLTVGWKETMADEAKVLAAKLAAEYRAATPSHPNHLGDVRWCAIEDGQPGPGTGRHIACFILDPA